MAVCSFVRDLQFRATNGPEKNETVELPDANRTAPLQPICDRRPRIQAPYCRSVHVGGTGEEEEGPASKDYQPEAAPTGDQPSKVLERAFKLYDGEDFYSASIELNKVVEGESGDTEANKQKAEFWMGKALYNMKFYSASLSYFDRIVQKGPSHAYYNATLKWLASLSRQLPDSTGILEKIGKYNRAELDQPALEKVRDELYFLLGKFYYQKGSFKEAVELFSTVPTTSEFYVQAKLFEGATHVREYQAKPAVESFKEVLRASAESTKPEIKPFEDLANLSLARTFYSTGQFELAAKYFDRVSPGVVRLGQQPLRVVVGELHAQAEGLLEGARQHPHDPGAVLRELHQARDRSPRA